MLQRFTFLTPLGGKLTMLRQAFTSMRSGCRFPSCESDLMKTPSPKVK